MNMSTSAKAWSVVPRWLREYAAISKPRVTGMALFATVAGFYLAHAGPIRSESLVLLVATVMGTALVGAGASALNQVIERDYDALMERTSHRPIPAGRLSVRHALCFGFGTSIAGLCLLAARVNLVCAGVALTALVAYLAAYTPLKRVTRLAVLVGAFPGALPPVIGWTAATGSLHARLLLPFAVLYVWQLPHVLSIAWRHRRDFARAGYPMLAVVDPTGTRTFRRMIGYSFILIPVSLFPTTLGLAGHVYYFGAFVCGFAFLAFACEVARLRTRDSARQHFLASLVYLALVFALMTADKLPS